MPQEPENELPPAGVFFVCARCGRRHRDMRLAPDVEREFVEAVAKWMLEVLLKEHNV